MISLLALFVVINWCLTVVIAVFNVGYNFINNLDMESSYYFAKWQNIKYHNKLWDVPTHDLFEEFILLDTLCGLLALIALAFLGWWFVGMVVVFGGMVALRYHNGKKA